MANVLVIIRSMCLLEPYFWRVCSAAHQRSTALVRRHPTAPRPHMMMGTPHAVPKPVRVAVLALVTVLYHPNPNPRRPNQ